ncbi:MAG: trans-aconitate 2-methyltransferase [bacterium]
MDDVIDRFDDVAGDYEEFTDTVPNYDEMMRTIGEIFNVWAQEKSPRSICELGTGQGRHTRTIVEQFRPETYVGVDGAQSMIRRTRERFESYDGPTDTTFIQASFQDWTPDQHFDWIFSSLSIHHMEDSEKRRLFEKIHNHLNEHGRFLLCDLTRRPEGLVDFYREVERHRMLQQGLSEEEIQERKEIHVTSDVPAYFDDLVTWLKDTGFNSVDCVWKNFNRVILVGAKGLLS